MKRIYVEEQWCIGCHLCEYNCAHANSGISDMAKALKGKRIYPRIHIEEHDAICYAVSCRHCSNPICTKSCIAGAISKNNETIIIDKDKCVGCLTCVLVCPFGALAPAENGIMQKCELCLENSVSAPACVTGCPNRAIVFEDRG